MPPVIWALDTNHDGIIESSEIDNAPQSLKKLDRRGTGQLTIPELLGPPPPRPRGGGQGEDGPPPPPPDDNGQGPNNGQNDGGQQPPPPPQ
jgi:hypothetical protein